MNQLTALALKDLKLLLRDRVGFFFTCCFPLIYCVFFGTIFASQGRGSGKIKVLVVDEDQTPGSIGFVQRLSDGGEFQIESEQREQAIERVRKGDRAAFVALPKGFGQSQERMFWGEPVTVQTGIDPSRQAEAGMIQGVLHKALYGGMQELFTDPEATTRRARQWKEDVTKDPDIPAPTRLMLEGLFSALEVFMKSVPRPEPGSAGAGPRWEPLRVETVPITRQRRGPKNPYEVTFPQGIIWGVMGSAAGFGISLVIERTGGTLVRLRTSPLSRWQILGGKALACFATTMAIQIFLIGLGMAVFGIRPWSIPLLLLAFTCVATGFVGIMMLLSVLGKTEQAAGGIGWGVLVMMAMIGGGMIPQFFMPEWLQKIGVISPIHWAIRAMDGAVWRQYSLAEMALPCGVLLGIGLLCFLLGSRAFKWTVEG